MKFQDYAPQPRHRRTPYDPCLMQAWTDETGRLEPRHMEGEGALTGPPGIRLSLMLRRYRRRLAKDGFVPNVSMLSQSSAVAEVALFPVPFASVTGPAWLACLEKLFRLFPCLRAVGLCVPEGVSERPEVATALDALRARWQHVLFERKTLGELPIWFDSLQSHHEPHMATTFARTSVGPIEDMCHSAELLPCVRHVELVRPKDNASWRSFITGNGLVRYAQSLPSCAKISVIRGPVSLFGKTSRDDDHKELRCSARGLVPLGVTVECAKKPHRLTAALNPYGGGRPESAEPLSAEWHGVDPRGACCCVRCATGVGQACAVALRRRELPPELVNIVLAFDETTDYWRKG